MFSLDTPAAKRVLSVCSTLSSEGSMQSIPERQMLTKVAMKIGVMIVVIARGSLPWPLGCEIDAGMVDDVENQIVDQGKKTTTYSIGLEIIKRIFREVWTSQNPVPDRHGLLLDAPYISSIMYWKTTFFPAMFITI